jgi:4-carboxymuconolactone decarboxylase
MTQRAGNYDEGMKCRREVLGDEYVDAKMAKVDYFTADFQQMVTEYGWGASWARGVLARRDRSIMNLGMLAALNRPEEFKLHFKGAINNGLTVTELREICQHVAIYCGIPASIEAFKLAREVFDQEGIDVSVPPDEGLRAPPANQMN